jgi:bifunctional non-homologous end joining protein LigD
VLTTLDVLETISPMLATAARPEVLTTLVGSHVFDQKLDGVRALAAWSENDFAIRNRNGRDLTMAYPDLCLASTQYAGPMILDGEIIAESGKFEDIAWRDKQKGHADAVRKVPARFVAFDVLHHPTEGDVRHLPYARRRQLLQGLALSGHFDISLASPDPQFFERIKALGGEGVIAKNLQAPYAKGRSNDWLKIKAVYSVTAIVTGYEPGSGARGELGAILVSLLEDMPNGGRMVRPIGKAGSGFSVKTSLEMKALIEAAIESGALGDFPIVEVECLSVTRSGVLRQPTYKGLRSDKGALDCTVDQLSDIPRS